MLNRRLSGYLPAVGAAVLATSCAQQFTPTQPCTGIATSFEFTDTTGEFVLDENGLAATFRGGLAQRVGNLSLYRTGLFAWMVRGGDTATIEFDPPAERVHFFFRDQLDSNAGELTFFDDADQVIATFDAATAFAEVMVSIDPATESPIARITLVSSGADGFTVIDDFEACAPDGDGNGSGGNGDTPDAQPIENPIPNAISRGNVRVRLETVASGLVAPNWAAHALGHPNHLFVVDQPGMLWSIDLDSGDKSIILDVADRLVPLGSGGPGTFDERGLLGAAFHPDFQTNGLLYTYTSEPVAGAADFSTMPEGAAADHQSVITEWRVTDPALPDSSVDVASAREILRIDQPQFNHNGGALNFGPDGMLYIALGDGGGADDVDGQSFGGGPMVGHGANGNGQNAGNPLGAVLRIDPTGDDSANGQYAIPPDNPFVDSQDGALPEIFAYGFRNPFRFSFDSQTGDLYLADVGQNDIEEINIVTSGGNYGWNWKEGSFFFDPNGNGDGFVKAQATGAPDDLVDPIAEYDHDEGLAIVGGFVYRAADIPELTGQYVFGDFAQTFSNDGRVFYLDDAGVIQEFELVGQTELGLSLLGFGQDSAGRIYVLGNTTGTPFEQTGVVLRIAPDN